MSSPSLKLYRLRGIFVAYFALKTIVGIVVALGIMPKGIGAGFGGWRLPPGALLLFSLMVAAIILAVALFIFARLLQRRNWARVLLLVIGWLAVLGSVFSLLASTQISEMGSWLARLAPGMDMDWEKLLQFDRVQKVFELLFWGYLLSVLQFDPAVRGEFLPPAPAGDGPQPGNQP